LPAWGGSAIRVQSPSVSHFQPTRRSPHADPGRSADLDPHAVRLRVGERLVASAHEPRAWTAS
jgi:hypothetical protein